MLPRLIRDYIVRSIAAIRSLGFSRMLDKTFSFLSLFIYLSIYLSSSPFSTIFPTCLLDDRTDVVIDSRSFTFS